MNYEELYSLAGQVEERLQPVFRGFERTAERNTKRVLDAFRAHRVSEPCFAGTTGYGYDDLGRETLEKVYADVFGAEAALVRTTFVNGTHAIACALYGALQPGNTILAVTGAPYDTLHTAITGFGRGSLASLGIRYEQLELASDGGPDYAGITRRVSELRPAAAFVQRSRGYAPRRALAVSEIGEIVRAVKEGCADTAVIVDNCYGEFTEIIEPSDVGADMIVGSLIKNPGGGLAPTGGYICGTQECVDQCAYRLTAPGLGAELGATLGLMQSFFQGFFLAPTVTASAVKGAIFAAGVYEKLGYRCVPSSAETRHDIIQAIELRSKEAMVAFCKGVQSAAPVDSYVTPEPYPMPGYDSEVIMAAGAFVQGSSIELSADGPIREPYAIYYQGGLTWAHAKLGILMSLQKMCDAGLITLPEA